MKNNHDFELSLLKIFIACFPDELLQRYRPIADFLSEYKSVTMADIVPVLDEYLPDERNYFDTICGLVSTMSEAEKETFYEPIQVLVAINSRYYETPGERNLVKYKLSKIFGKEI
jgi:hypothetical protein